MSKQSYIEYLYEQKNKKGGSSKKILEVNIKDFNEFFKEYEKAFKNGLFKKKQSDFNKTHQLLMSLSEQKNIDPKIKNIIMKCISLYDSAFNTNFFNNKNNEKTNEIKKVIINPNKSKITINPNKSKITKNIKKVKPINIQLHNSLSSSSYRNDTNMVSDIESLQIYSNEHEYNIKWEEAGAGGDCFFKAISLGLFGKSDNYQHVRNFIANKIKDMDLNHWNMYKVSNALKIFNNKEDYENKMRHNDNTSKSWGGQFEYKYFITRNLRLTLIKFDFECYEFSKDKVTNKYICTEHCTKEKILKNNILAIAHTNGNHWIGTKSRYNSFPDNLKTELKALFNI